MEFEVPEPKLRAIKWYELHPKHLSKFPAKLHYKNFWVYSLLKAQGLRIFSVINCCRKSVHSNWAKFAFVKEILIHLFSYKEIHQDQYKIPLAFDSYSKRMISTELGPIKFFHLKFTWILPFLFFLFSKLFPRTLQSFHSKNISPIS